MAGYHNFSMSNNAIRAYQNGLLPASKFKIPLELIERFCRYAEWHHSSKMYNKVKFYKVAEVKSTFGLALNDAELQELDGENYENTDAIAALHNYDTKSYVLENCTVKWLDWSKKGAPATNRCETNCSIKLKGMTATITLLNGKTFQKRKNTNGFQFYKNVI